MKTILQVHIFVRLCASASALYGLYLFLIAWPQVVRLRGLMEKQKENTEIMGDTFDFSAFIPTFSEILLGPFLLLTAGLFGLLCTRKIVEWIIGPDPMKTLMHLDRQGEQTKSR
ncbi:hypothetical protein [Coraliomargarita parva]|uniref:hypothetical protein n=1 Tax=Coraliomargarita parva TaxID=3014050 RepID=UPI0022B54A74|nr:hypothetical protein [Coraliomargarita parva]